MNRMKKSRIAAMVLLFSLCFSACENKQEAKQVMEMEVSKLDEEQTTTVTRGKVEDYFLLEGCIAPKVHQVAFEEEGKFKKYTVNLGDEVTKGQVLAIMDESVVKQKIETMKMQLSETKADYEYQMAYLEKTIAAYGAEMDGYYEKLEKDKEDVSGGDYTQHCMELGVRDVEKKRLELEKKHLKENYELESAHLQEQINKDIAKLDNLELKAPCDGVVIAKYDTENETNVRKENYYVAIAEKDIYYVRCEYVLPGYFNTIQKSTAFRNGKEYDLTPVTLDTKVYNEMTNNGEEIPTYFLIDLTGSDMDYGDAVLVKLLKNSKENVLTIPNISIKSEEAGKYVMKQTEGKKEKIYIRDGISDGVITEVESGLAEGDVIYVAK